MKALVALFAATLCMTAAAGDEKQDKHKDQTMERTSAQFESLDRNKDQRLSKSEVQSDETLSGQFAAADTDADGYLSRTEFMSHWEGGKTRRERPY